MNNNETKITITTDEAEMIWIAATAKAQEYYKAIHISTNNEWQTEHYRKLAEKYSDLAKRFQSYAGPLGKK